MESAIAAVQKGVSLRRAAEMYSIPRSTLHDHVSGKVKEFGKQGTNKEELQSSKLDVGVVEGIVPTTH